MAVDVSRAKISAMPPWKDVAALPVGRIAQFRLSITMLGQWRDRDGGRVTVGRYARHTRYSLRDVSSERPLTKSDVTSNFRVMGGCEVFTLGDVTQRFDRWSVYIYTFKCPNCATSWL